MIGIGDLENLAGMADSLEATVVPELRRGPARRQVQAAVAMLRRIAFTADRIAPALAADIADMEDTLAQAIERLASLPQSAQALRAALRQGLDEGHGAEPARRHAALEALLAQLQDGLGQLGTAPADRAGIDGLLRGLFRRSAARELALIPPARGQ